MVMGSQRPVPTALLSRKSFVDLEACLDECVEKEIAFHHQDSNPDPCSL